MKLPFLLLCILSGIGSCYAQTSLETLETKAEAVKVSEGGVSIAYANAILEVSNEQRNQKQWNATLASINKANKIAIALRTNIRTKESSWIQRLNTLDATIQGAKYKYNLLQKELPRQCFGLQGFGSWCKRVLKQQQTAAILELIDFSFTHFSCKTSKGIFYWQQAYIAAQEVKSTNRIFIENLWSKILTQIAKEFGKESEEYTGALFGQANYYRRIGNTTKAKLCQAKVEARWGKVNWGMKPFNVEDIISESIKVPSVSHHKAEVSMIAEQMPRFCACDDTIGDANSKRACADMSMMNFVYSNIVYHDMANIPASSSVVVISFVVEEKGYITNTIVTRDPHPKMSLETLRILLLMNELPFRWIPGKNKGKAVQVKMNFPMRFRFG